MSEPKTNIETLEREGGCSPATCSVWRITPAESSQYDFEYHRQSEDPDGRKALERAKWILEALWDGSESLETFDISVRIEREEINEEDFPDPDDF